jgi:hypothetical protein
MLMSHVVLLILVVRHVDFLLVWEIGQNAITFTYSVHLRKKLYGRNQRDDTDAMVLVSFDFENFHF